jgi:hypothetical protein
VATASIQLSGTFAATVQFESSVGGTVWTAITSSNGAVSSATAAGTYTFNLSGARFLRARASAYTSGTIQVDIGTATSPGATWFDDGVTVTAPSGRTVKIGASLLTNVEFDNGTCTTAKTIDPANGNRQKVTLTNAQTCVLTFTQPTGATMSLQLKVIQSAAGSFNGLISGGKWPGAVVPTITATTGAVDIVSCYLDGTDAKCVATQDFR